MPKYIIERFPESFNELRKQLSTNHEDLWAKVGYNMAYNHLQFITDMNAELDVFTIPEMTINECCEKYLAALKNRVGKPARKSLALLEAEASGRVLGGVQHIFGSDEDYAERKERQEWEAKKAAGNGIIVAVSGRVTKREGE